MSEAEDAPDQPTKDRSGSYEGAVLPPQDVANANHVYIHGYLHKKTRDGRWQKRWFETNGCFLTYYKNKKMAKLLAALNLPQVGEIKMLDADHPDDVDNTGSLFAIALNDREYMLKAAKKEDAEMWVTKLNLLKANPQSNPATASANTDGMGREDSAAAENNSAPTSVANTSPKSEKLAAVTDASPDAWSKLSRFGCC